MSEWGWVPVIFAAGIVCADGDPQAEELLRAADAARLTLEEGVMRIGVSVLEPDGQATESALDVYVQGQDRVLCVFREGRLSGRRIVIAEQRVWLLVPGTTNPIPISANQRLLGGASIADVARLRLAEDFDGRVREESETLDGVPCRVVDLERATPKAPYASGTLWIGARDLRPRRLRLALRSGKEAKEIDFTRYVRDQGRMVLGRMEIRHLLAQERGMVTRLEFVRYEHRRLAPELFDPVRARDLP